MGYFNGPPGITVGRSTANRVVFLQRSETFLAQGKMIDTAKSRDPGNTNDIGVLRPGTLMGRITATGLYCPSVIGVLQGAVSATGTSITITADQAVELVRRIGTTGTIRLVGPPTAAGTVATWTETYSAVNTTTGVVTTSALDADLIAGSFVAGNDGSYLPVTFISDWAPTGVLVLDETGAALTYAEMPKFPVAGVVDSSQLLPWPTDTSLQTWITSSINQLSGGKFVFDHTFQ